jgi:hypothetical protein
MCDLLWSDPEEIEEWENNPRGAGVIFGVKLVDKFLKTNGIDCIFKQVIENFQQNELPDYWLTRGNPWETMRLDIKYTIKFYGDVKSNYRYGKQVRIWEAGEEVEAIAFDTAIPGWNTHMTELENCSDINLLVKLDINDLMGCLNEQPVKLQKDFKTFVDRTVQERRQSSSIIALRDLHNWVKRTLITNCVGLLKQKVISLLDIAVGRGGDIDKWNKAGIKHVFGFDVSPESISSNDPFNPGAIQRLENYAKGSTNIHFEVGDAIHPTGELLDSIENFMGSSGRPGFGITSCQFALHYFFGSKTDLDTSIKVASRYLQPGGYLIFTSMDSTKIRSFFTSRKFKVYDRPLFNIKISRLNINEECNKGCRYFKADLI